MALKIWELISIVLSAVVGGMYWGPWRHGIFRGSLFTLLDILDRLRGRNPGFSLDVVHRRLDGERLVL